MQSDLCVHQIPVAAGVEDGLKGRAPPVAGRLIQEEAAIMVHMQGGEAPRGAHHPGTLGVDGPCLSQVFPPHGALGSCRGLEWAPALMLQAENRMRAAKGIKVVYPEKRCLGMDLCLKGYWEEAENQLSPPNGGLSTGTLASSATRGGRVDT